MSEILSITAPYTTLLVLVVIFTLIYRSTFQPLRGLFLAVLLLMLLGTLSLDELIEGVANQAIASILLLIVIASSLNRHFQLVELFNRFIVHNRGYNRFLGSMMFFTSLMSSVMNNTAVVAVMSNYVYDWSIKNKISPSKVMMPLSFAAILGGMITLVGTSTTLILNGFMSSYNIPSLNPISLLLLGLTVTIAGISFFIVFGKKLLPDRPELIKDVTENQKKYLVEVLVTSKSSILGKSIKDSGLRNLDSFYLVEVVRAGTIISPVTPNERILENDSLLFAGDTEEIKSLLALDNGLALPNHAENLVLTDRLSEVVISFNSSLAGKKIRNSGFRSKYDAAILAIHRNGEKLAGKLGNIIVRAGDVLLVSTGNDFEEKADLYKDLYIISTSEPAPLQKKVKKWPLALLILIVIALLMTNILSLLGGLLVIFGFLFFLNVIDFETLKRELDINLAGILILSLAIGKATINSGAAHLISDSLLGLVSPLGESGVLLSIIILTAILTTFITNVAAVSIAFPIALDLSQSYPDMATSFYLGIAFAASAAFLTPISYQTNLIVSGPGGYKFSDFTKVGFPLFVIYLTLIYAGLLVLK